MTHETNEEISIGNGTLVVDIDGTICPLKRPDQEYADLTPIAPMVEKLREYQRCGYTILLHTSRNMNTHKNNIGKINLKTAPVLLAWIERWNIPCDELLFGKPWPGERGFYIDDRAIRPDEFLKYSDEEIHSLLNNCREG